MVRLMGGLGNQMFQYAAALQLATLRKTMSKVDLTFLLDRAPRANFTQRDFDLVIFNLVPEIASSKEVRPFRRIAERASGSVFERMANKLARRTYYLERSPAFDVHVLDLPDETYLEGYFQNERYFADIAPAIRQGFSLKLDPTEMPAETRGLEAEIRSGESVCLHVRRGDYVTSPDNIRLLGYCSLDYYKTALAQLRSRGVHGRVFVFSDDLKWCRENLNSAELTVVGEEHAGPRASTYFWLMTLCKHFVISNSSFGWWAAWLSESPHKTVIRPAPWFQAPEVREFDICPPGWLSIPKH